MIAQQQEMIELADLGNAVVETRQHWISVEYPDNIFGRGPYPGWLEGSAQHPEDLTTL